MIDYVRLDIDEELHRDIERTDISVSSEYFAIVHHEEYGSLVIHDPGLDLVSSIKETLLRFVPEDALTFRIRYDIVVNFSVSVRDALEKSNLKETPYSRTARLPGAHAGNGNMAIIIYGLDASEVLAIKLALQKSK